MIGKVIVGLGVAVVGIGALLLGGGDAGAAEGGGGFGPGPGPGGGGGKDLDITMSCNAAFNKLGPTEQAAAQYLLSQPRTPEIVASLGKLAATFDEMAARPEAASIANELRIAATCLRTYASTGTLPSSLPVPGPGGGSTPTPGPGGGPAPGVIVDDFNVPSSPDGSPAKKGIQSNPLFQWVAPIASGDSAWAVTTRVFGKDAATPDRLVALIQNNPVEWISKRPMPTVGDPNNPVSTGYNFKDLRVGDRLALPKSWNPWVDQTGVGRGGPLPYPKA